MPSSLAIVSQAVGSSDGASVAASILNRYSELIVVPTRQIVNIELLEA